MKNGIIKPILGFFIVIGFILGMSYLATLTTNCYLLVILLILTLFSMHPLVITLIWLFNTRKLGYSWKETSKIEDHNAQISCYERAGYMAGYSLKDIRAELPSRITYRKKNKKSLL